MVARRLIPSASLGYQMNDCDGAGESGELARPTCGRTESMRALRMKRVPGMVVGEVLCQLVLRKTWREVCWRMILALDGEFVC